LQGSDTYNSLSVAEHVQAVMFMFLNFECLRILRARDMEDSDIQTVY